MLGLSIVPVFVELFEEVKELLVRIGVVLRR
jgi:hypothetical protein